MAILWLNLVTILLLSISAVCVSESGPSSVSYSTWNSGLPVRRVLEYEFNVTWFTGAPNGITKQILGVNGQFPGPTIRGTKGDLLRVRVRNLIQPKLNMSIHWHGMHQKGSSFMDGVEQVSQCPLVYGATQVYEFQLLQTGTHWWHSHYGPHLADGLWGLIIVDNEPEVWGHLYQDELMITFTDWFFKTGQQLTDWYLGPDNIERKPPYPHSFLINGQGYYPCHNAEREGLQCVQKPRAPLVFEVVKGTSYRIRLLSAASALQMRFSIENHTMTCIEADGVDTELGAPVDWVPISSAMRYSFIVKMDAENSSVGSEFLIRVKSYFPSDFNKSNMFPFYDARPKDIDAYAILRYVESKSSSVPLRNSHEWTAYDESRTSFSGVALDESLHCLARENDLAPDYFDQEIQVRFDAFKRQDGTHFWTTNGVQFKIVEGQLPAIFKTIRNESQPEYANALYTSGNGSIVQLVINTGDVQGQGHPVHLHGHSFWIVGAGKDGDGDYSPEKHGHLLRTKVPKRDTTRFQARSWLVLRYVADNPGVWFLHCHVNWHVPGGMGAVIVEGADVLRKQFNEIPSTQRDICVKAGIMELCSNEVEKSKTFKNSISNRSSKAWISRLIIYFIVGIQLITL